MFSKIIPKEHAGSHSNHQKFFAQYILALLVNLVSLNLFNEYWDYVLIDSFSISLLTAIVLASLLKLTIIVEHKMATYFKSKSGLAFKVIRWLSTWAVIFVAKLIILKVISLSFGEHVVFSGPVHGLVSFIVVVTAILVLEQLIIKKYHSLA
ncbi:MAG: hypothetical protein OQL19_06385 [Gammaproteobacteria bacterium]|nr:hypothetical protein [Gammaproteobacteria bacterium]